MHDYMKWTHGEEHTRTQTHSRTCAHTPWSLSDCICWMLKVCDNLRGSKRIKPSNDYT